MMTYKEIYGDLIDLALKGKFDVIAHGCNCFCTMGAGIAPQMARAFGADEFPLEIEKYADHNDPDDPNYFVLRSTGNNGDINKLGQIDYKLKYIWKNHPAGGPRAMNHMTVGQANVEKLVVVNAYTQYGFGSNHEGGSSTPLDYNALRLCLKKMNHKFKGLHIGLPQIGCGLAGGNWKKVKGMIKYYLQDTDVTVVIYKPKTNVTNITNTTD